MKPENIEFLALFEASGWKAVEAARRLHVTRATLSRYLSGEIAPSSPVLELYKVILAAEKPGSLTASGALREATLADWERRVVDDLRWLHVEDRQRVLNAMRAFINGLPRRQPVSYGPRCRADNADNISSRLVASALSAVRNKRRAAKTARPGRLSQRQLKGQDPSSTPRQ